MKEAEQSAVEDAMDRKDALLEVIEQGIRLTNELATRLGKEAREARGTYERWAPKDALAHSAEWLSRDIERLRATRGPLPSFGDENLDEENQAIFAKYAGKTWGEVYEFASGSFARARDLAASLSDEELEVEREFDDGSKRTAWRMLAGHALMHPSGHLTLVLDREGFRDEATAMEETTAKVLEQLDDSPEWLGTIRYNLACRFALIGDPSRALPLLRKAFAGRPDLVEWSQKDSDLDGIRDHPEFGSVFPV